MRRWYNTWMTVNLRPDARFEVTLAPIKHLTTDLRIMPRPKPWFVRLYMWAYLSGREVGCDLTNAGSIPAAHSRKKDRDD